MHFRIPWLLLWIVAYQATAQVEPLVIRSRSDQFIVFGMPSGRSPRMLQPFVDSKALGQGNVFWLSPASPGPLTNAAIVLEPQLVAVSCERIKDALLRELKENDATVHSRIYIQLNPRLRREKTRVIADRYERGWMYGIDLPDRVDENFYSAVILQVLLYEMANRQSVQEQIDLPPWLVSGLVSHLQATTLQSLALQPNMELARVRVKMDPLAKARKTFEQDLPLTFEEMSWPGTLRKHRSALFRDSAHFFVHQLLELPHGRESLKNFIQNLQHHRNWQFAFLAAFKEQFNDLVAVEKWWSVNFVHFMGRDASQQWSLEESWRQLKAALDVTMQVHLDANRMPVIAEYNLQEAIAKWDNVRQDVVIHKALQQLRILRFRTHAELRPLVESYRKVLEKYLEQRAKIGRPVGKKEQQITAPILKRATCKQLDMLDEERARVHKGLFSTQAASR